MLAHAEREQPREAVGLLAGHPSGPASLALPLVNIAGPGAFLADPYSQYLAEKRIAAEGLSRLAIYHSHPGGGAALSAADRTFAQRHNTIHLVIALAHGDCPLDIRAYHVRPDRVVPVTVHAIAPR
jgi:proteasome lid subunit RPN8/RPN11